MMVTSGTVHCEKANSNLAPCLIRPPYSCAVPGRKPGTSTKVTMGMLKASQNRTNRAALREASLSSTPASTIGWLATKPTVRPAMRPKPVTMFLAKVALVDDLQDQFLHVVGLVGMIGDQRVQGHVDPLDVVKARPFRHAVGVVGRQEVDQPAHLQKRLDVVLERAVRDRGARRMHRGAAELF